VAVLRILNRVRGAAVNLKSDHELPQILLYLRRTPIAKSGSLLVDYFVDSCSTIYCSYIAYDADRGFFYKYKRVYFVSQCTTYQ